MKRCPKCKWGYWDVDNFCTTDGAALVIDDVCPNCNRPISPANAFCGNCGIKQQRDGAK